MLPSLRLCLAMPLTSPAPTTTTAPFFWRDAALPFVDLRAVEDGRQVCYASHSHDSFSIGAITGGRSTYRNGAMQETVAAGTVVLINPDTVHCCNPIDDQPWSYLMFYFAPDWLAEVQQGLGAPAGAGFRPLAARLSRVPAHYQGLLALHRLLIDPQAETLHKHGALIQYCSDLLLSLGESSAAATLPLPPPGKLAEVAAFIRAQCTRALSLDEICAAVALSPSYLIRAFKKQYGLTPHAYLTDQRIRYACRRLKQGEPLAEVALAAGFADQAHFQRVFKQHAAATPGQYRAA